MSTGTATAMVTDQLGTEKVSKLLWRYALPSIIAMSAASLYNIIDSIFIGHGVGAMAITGLAITMPLMNLAAAFGAMVGIGAASLLSIKLGQNDRESASEIVGNVVILNTIIGVCFSAICLMFLDPILYLFGASDTTIVYARDFMRIILIGNVITSVYLGLNNCLRASGHPRKSMVIMLIAILTNCVLGAIFIFWFGWGVSGAALATVIAQFVAAVMEVAHFMSPKHEIRFRRGVFKLKRRIVNGILSIGIAPFLMNVTASVVVVFINNALQNTGGDMSVGAYGIVNRVALLFLMILFGFNQGMQPIIGYNYGAGKNDRVHATLKLGVVIAVSITTFGFLLSQIAPGMIAMMFTTNPEMVATAKDGLRIALFMFPVVGFQIVISSFFQSIGQAKNAILLSLSRQLLFLLPLLIILPPIYGSNGVWLSMPISDLASAIMAFFMFLYYFKRINKPSNI